MHACKSIPSFFFSFFLLVKIGFELFFQQHSLLIIFIEFYHSLQLVIHNSRWNHLLTCYIGKPIHPSGQSAAFRRAEPIIKLHEGSSLLHWAASHSDVLFQDLIARGFKVSFFPRLQRTDLPARGLEISFFKAT